MSHLTSCATHSKILDEIEMLSAKAKDLQRTLEQLAKQMPDAQLLMMVPGIGVLTATAGWASR